MTCELGVVFMVPVAPNAKDGTTPTHDNRKASESTSQALIDVLGIASTSSEQAIAAQLAQQEN